MWVLKWVCLKLKVCRRLGFVKFGNFCPPSATAIKHDCGLVSLLFNFIRQVSRSYYGTAVKWQDHIGLQCTTKLLVINILKGLKIPIPKPEIKTKACMEKISFLTNETKYWTMAKNAVAQPDLRFGWGTAPLPSPFVPFSSFAPPFISPFLLRLPWGPRPTL